MKNNFFHICSIKQRFLKKDTHRMARVKFKVKIFLGQSHGYKTLGLTRYLEV